MGNFSQACGQAAGDSADADSGIQDLSASEPADSSNSQDRPINGKVGYRIDLGGAGSPAAGLKLSWQFTKLPKGSHPRIFDNSSEDPFFVPNEQGVYVVQGTGGLEKKTLTYTVGPGHTLVKIESRAVGDGVYDIVVDGTKYSGPKDPAKYGTNVVLLDRETLERVDEKTFTDIGLKTYLQNVLGNRDDVLAIISTNDRGPGFAVGEIAPELEQFGANHDFRGIDTSVPFSFIGIKKSSSGQAYQVGYTSLNLAGYLAPDASGKYAFLQTDFLTFETLPSTNLADPSIVRINGATVLSSDSSHCAGGGFLLGVLDRASLEVRSSASYCTLSDSPENSIAAQQALAAKLNAEARPNSPLAVRGRIEDLVFLVSFGQPHNGAGPPNFADLAYAINFAGGTYEAVYNVNEDDTYSLITSPDPTVTPWESGSQIEAGSAGAEEGILARGRLGNWYAPSAAIPAVGATNLGLDQILAQAPVDFPIPAAGDDGQQMAFKEISQLLCECDNLRPNYENTNVPLSGYFTTLTAQAKDPSHPGAPSCADTPMPETAYCVVRAQLLTEIGFADNTRAFANNLNSLWTAQNSNVGLVLADVTSKVNAAVQPKSTAKVSPMVKTVVGGILGIAKAIPPPAGTLIGVAHGAFLFASDLANDEFGDNDSLDATLEASQLAGATAENFARQLTATGVMFNSIFEDWGKLRSMGLALKSGAPGWFWNGGVTTGQLLNGFNLAAERADYQSLMPAVFVTRYWNAQSSAAGPWDYRYLSELFGIETMIFSKNTPSINYLDSPSPRAKGAAFPDFLTVSVAGGLPSGVRTQYRTPPASLLEHLVSDSTGELGIWKPEIIRHWLPIVWCGPPGNYYTGRASGCEESTIQMPLTSTGKPTAVSLSSSANPAIQGKEIAILAKVSAEDGSEETGEVQFTANGALLGFATLCHGEARLKTSSLPLGTDSIVATYLGNESSAVSVSAPFEETVKP